MNRIQMSQVNPSHPSSYDDPYYVEVPDSGLFIRIPESKLRFHRMRGYHRLIQETFHPVTGDDPWLLRRLGFLSIIRGCDASSLTKDDVMASFSDEEDEFCGLMEERFQRNGKLEYDRAEQHKRRDEPEKGEKPRK